MPHDDDLYDYSMSDQFISDTRQRPYRLGFRPRRHPRKPSLAYLNSLPDKDFATYVRLGCRLPNESEFYSDELDEALTAVAQLRLEVDRLRSEVERLRQSAARPAANHPKQRGLDVAAR